MNSKVKFGLLLVTIALITSFSMKSRPLSALEILDLVNRDRTAQGLSELSLNPTLNEAALAKAEDMTEHGYFAHTSPTGATPWHWFKDAGYNYTFAGENLAEGYSDAVDLENSWMASAAHRANILSPHYSEIGLAVVEYRNKNLVVQLFGSKDAKLTFNSK